MERLYERECDTFIHMLEQSREDIAQTAEVIEEEQLALRSESRMFGKKHCTLNMRKLKYLSKTVDAGALMIWENTARSNISQYTMQAVNR